MSLVTAFSPGVRLESAIYRKGRLFIYISPEAALDPPNSLKNGMKAMERSLRAALPGMKRLSLTIGGEEPYVEGIQIEGATGIKKGRKRIDKGSWQRILPYRIVDKRNRVQ